MKLIELHILQSFPVTCLNRDDVGAPKSAVFGGAPRARVSSQCWKRAIRLMLQDSDSRTFGGQRTRFVVTAINDLFASKGQTEDAAQTLALSTAEALGKLDTADSGKVKTLLYFSPAELEAVAAAMLEQEIGDLLPVAGQPDSEDKEQQKKKKDACQSLNKLAEKPAKALATAVKDAADIAVFGRMVADDHSLMVEGAGMFSHALSTHRVANEVDFFSAVDDLKPEESEGAGHIGTLEFNSACYYRYVGLNWDLLFDEHHLEHFSDEERKQVVDAFLRAAILAVPNARHNSMFGHNPPDFVLGLVRTGQPLSLVNAFEEPVFSNNGYLQRSQKKMLEHFDTLKTAFSLDVTTDARIPDKSLDEFLKEIEQHV